MITKKFWMALLAILPAGLAFSGTLKDPIWLICEKHMEELLWMNYTVCDTFRGKDLARIYPTDTGDKYDSIYINFNYQFTADTIIFLHPYDSNEIYLKDYRPGYAGFKIDWDNGVTTFPVAKFSYLVVTHKGPLPDHTVTIRFGYNSGCGSPTTFNEIGSFSSSTAWKEDWIKIPDSITSIPEEQKTARNYYEMQVLITNADPSGSSTSAPGNFKIDNVYLTNETGAVITLSKTSKFKPYAVNIKTADQRIGLGKKFSGRLKSIAVYDLQGNLLYKQVTRGNVVDLGGLKKVSSEVRVVKVQTLD
jgi:hypothetical protein